MTGDTDGGGSAAVGAFSLDTVLEVLANRRRRFALYALADSTGTLGLLTLVEEVVTLEAALAGTAVTGEAYLEAGTDLYEWHLPVLADVGVIDCDARQREIRYRRDPLLAEWLERARETDLERGAP